MADNKALIEKTKNYEIPPPFLKEDDDIVAKAGKQLISQNIGAPTDSGDPSLSTAPRRPGEFRIDTGDMARSAARGMGFNPDANPYANLFSPKGEPGDFLDQLVAAGIRTIPSTPTQMAEREQSYLGMRYPEKAMQNIDEQFKSKVPDSLAQYGSPNPYFDPVSGELRPEVMADLERSAKMQESLIPSTEGERLQAEAYKQVADMYAGGKNPERDLAKGKLAALEQQLGPQGAELKGSGAYDKGIVAAEAEKETAFEKRKKEQADFTHNLDALKEKYPSLSTAELRKRYSPWYKALVGGLQALAKTSYSPIDEEIQGIRDNYAREYNDLLKSEKASEDEYRLVNDQYVSRLDFMAKLANIESEVWQQKYNVETSPLKKADADLNYGRALAAYGKAETMKAAAIKDFYTTMKAQADSYANDPRMLPVGFDPNNVQQYRRIKSDNPTEIKYVQEQFPKLKVAADAAAKIKAGLRGQLQLSNHDYTLLARQMQAYAGEKFTEEVVKWDVMGVKFGRLDTALLSMANSVEDYVKTFLNTHTTKAQMNPLLLKSGAPIVPLNKPAKE